MKTLKVTNGVEPPEGAWVYASTGDCPSRYVHQRRGDEWVDAHGCSETWDALIDPIDTLPPLTH